MNKILSKIRQKIINKKNYLYRQKEKKLIQLDSKIDTAYFGTNYGGFSIATTELKRTPIVYSFGIGEDISFDTELINKFNAKVFGFDPTPKSIEWLEKQNLNNNFKFYPIGIASFDGKTRFFESGITEDISGSIVKHHDLKATPIEVEMKTFSTITSLLKHEYIDIVKLDIEGAEFEVVPQILQQDNVYIKQLCFETHERFFPDKNIKFELIKKIKKYGYNLIYISNDYMEFTFLKP